MNTENHIKSVFYAFISFQTQNLDVSRSNYCCTSHPTRLGEAGDGESPGVLAGGADGDLLHDLLEDGGGDLDLVHLGLEGLDLDGGGGVGQGKGVVGVVGQGEGVVGQGQAGVAEGKDLELVF